MDPRRVRGTPGTPRHRGERGADPRARRALDTRKKSDENDRFRRARGALRPALRPGAAPPRRIEASRLRLAETVPWSPPPALRDPRFRSYGRESGRQSGRSTSSARARRGQASGLDAEAGRASPRPGEAPLRRTRRAVRRSWSPGTSGTCKTERSGAFAEAPGLRTQDGGSPSATARSTRGSGGPEVRTTSHAPLMRGRAGQQAAFKLPRRPYLPTGWDELAHSAMLARVVGEREEKPLSSWAGGDLHATLDSPRGVLGLFYPKTEHCLNSTLPWTKT